MVFGLLLAVGSHMIWKSFCEEEESEKLDPTRGWAFISLTVITILDALATGLALAFQRANIVALSLPIGSCTFIIATLGLVTRPVQLPVRAMGGLILIGTGTSVLVEHPVG